MANNKRTTKKQATKRKGKSLRVNGEQYWLVKRADGRYNIYKEGHQGTMGSTPLTSARDFSEARSNIKKLELEFNRMEAEAAGNVDNIVTLDEYENATAENDAVDSAEDFEDENDSDSPSKRNRGSRRPTRVGARARGTMGWANDKLSDKVMDFGDKQFEKGMQGIRSSLSEVAAKRGVVGAAAGYTNKKVAKLQSKQSNTMRQNRNAIEGERQTLRNARVDEAKKANTEALRRAKAEGYKKLADEQAQLQIQIEQAKASGDQNALARANQSMEDLNRRKREFDKVIPQDFKFPYKLPSGTAKHSSQKRAQNKVIRQVETDDILRERGRRAAAKLERKESRRRSRAESSTSLDPVS